MTSLCGKYTSINWMSKYYVPFLRNGTFTFSDSSLTLCERPWLHILEKIKLLRVKLGENKNMEQYLNKPTRYSCILKMNFKLLQFKKWQPKKKLKLCVFFRLILYKDGFIFSDWRLHVEFCNIEALYIQCDQAPIVPTVLT